MEWKGGSPPGQKNFGVNPGGLLNAFSFSDLGGTPVGYANFRRGAPSRKLLLFLMWFAQRANDLDDDFKNATRGVFSLRHAIGAFVASVAFVASPIDRAKASLCRRRAENGSPALDLLKRCTDVFDELAEFGVTVRGGDAQLERSVFDRRQREEQQRYVGIVQRVERAVEFGEISVRRGLRQGRQPQQRVVTRAHDLASTRSLPPQPMVSKSARAEWENGL